MQQLLRWEMRHTGWCLVQPVGGVARMLALLVCGGNRACWELLTTCQVAGLGANSVAQNLAAAEAPWQASFSAALCG